MIIRAKYVVPMNAPVLEDGAVVIRGERISRVGKYKDIRRDYATPPLDLGEMVLMPGLINAHCHLDYTHFHQRIPENLPFVEWIKAINQLKRASSLNAYLDAIQQGERMLIASGTTSVVNIEAVPELLLHMQAPTLRSWWCLEMLDIRKTVPSPDSVAGQLLFFEDSAEWIGGFGLSPHAPFTASLPLYQAATEYTNHSNLIFTTHLAESQPEMEMYQNASGPLYDFLAGFGRSMDDCGHQTPLQHLFSQKGIPRGAILAHLNCLTDSDFTLLQKSQASLDVHAVHCPQSHQYFQHPEFQYDRFLDAEIPVLLGTDSLASSPSLSLFDEMQTFSRHFPHISPQEILYTTTTLPAKALHLQHALGCISRGAYADLIAFPVSPSFNASPHSPYETIIHHQSHVPFVLINGTIVAHTDNDALASI